MEILKSRSEILIQNWKHGIKYNYEKSGYKKGLEHPNWKGGRFKDSRGYILIYVGKGNGRHKNQSYNYEHVSTWEKYHGKQLPKNWLIHHLNGIRNDNRPENLFAMERKNHISEYPNTYVRKLQEYIKELEERSKSQ